MRITSDTDLGPLLDPPPELVIATLDEGPWEAREAVARACAATGTPFLFVSGHTVGPLWLEAGDPCARCLGEVIVGGRTIASWSSLVSARGTKFGSAPAMPMDAASVAVSAATDLLADCSARPPLRGRVWRPSQRYGSTLEELDRSRTCPGCPPLDTNGEHQ